MSRAGVGDLGEEVSAAIVACIDSTGRGEISDEDFQQKREKCGGKLERAYEGPTFEVFTKALRGLSSAKVTRPGSFKAASGEGHAIRCSYKSDDGILPLSVLLLR